MANLSGIVAAIARLSLTNGKTITTMNTAGCRLLHTSVVSHGKAKFIKLGIDVNKYTMKPLKLTKSGGRGSDGRVQTHHVGGGHRQRYRMLDFKKVGPKEGPPRLEKVMEIRYDPCRTADIAVVAGEERQRYIIASDKMKPGDIVKTSCHIPIHPVKAEEGDSYPVGALAIGTVIHSVEFYPGGGAKVARAAGTCSILLRKFEETCIIQMPSKREMSVSQECMATVGRVSNIDHDKEHIGSAGRARWFGVRPQSGLKQRKTGYNGKKMKPIKKLVAYDKPVPPKPATYRWTV